MINTYYHVPAYRSVFDSILNTVSEDLTGIKNTNEDLYIFEIDPIANSTFNVGSEKYSFMFGYTSTLDDDKICVSIAKSCLLMQIKAFCHELIHVNQAAEKRLSFYNDYLIFEDKAYTTKTIKTMLYDDLPWEKEAFEKEWILTKKALNNLSIFIKTTIVLDFMLIKHDSFIRNFLDKKYLETIDDLAFQIRA